MFLLLLDIDANKAEDKEIIDMQLDTSYQLAIGDIDIPHILKPPVDPYISRCVQVTHANYTQMYNQPN